jgi:hypothetical protein
MPQQIYRIVFRLEMLVFMGFRVYLTENFSNYGVCMIVDLRANAALGP